VRRNVAYWPLLTKSSSRPYVGYKGKTGIDLRRSKRRF
jgi:hypothetical protein